MGKTKDILKKIRDTKGTFHAKMGAIKDQKGEPKKKVARIHKGTIPKST